MEKQKKIQNKKKNYKLIIVSELLFIAVCMGVMIYPSINALGIKKAIAMATTVKPETFTELYFENHTLLPSKVTLWKQYTFSFTIHNLEYRDMVYPYTIYIQRDNEKTVLYEDKVSLKKDGYITIEKTVGPFKDLRTRIVVELTNKNQIIAFWMEKP